MREVLIDTSVWCAHFRKAQPPLLAMLENGLVVSHEFIVGELALSMSAEHLGVLEDIADMGFLPTVTLHEYMQFVTNYRIAGRRIGFVDTHLLASCKLSDAGLWTLDTHLRAAAKDCDIPIF